jgi:nucleosome binding factor SPN SPT16 subunit
VSLITPSALYVHATTKKLEYLREAETLSAGAAFKVILITREKGDINVPANRAAIDTLLLAARADGSTRLGHFPTDTLEGVVAAGWVAEVKTAELELVDATAGLEAFFAVKDSFAITEIEAAGMLTARVMKTIMIRDMEGIINDGKIISHAALAGKVTTLLESRESLVSRKVPVDDDNFEAVLPVCFQSGGDYSLAALTPGAVTPSTSTLSHDVIIASVGMRLKTMRAGCARTLMIDPTPKMRETYEYISKTHDAMIRGLNVGDGTHTIGSAVTAARDVLTAMPNLPLEAKLCKNFGCSIGQRMSDKMHALTVKNTTVLRQGMVFIVTTGLSGIPMADKHASANAKVNSLSTYSVLLADTVLITADGPKILTDKSSRALQEVSYEMAGDDDEENDEVEEKKEKKEKKRESRVVVDETAGRDSRGRSARLKEKAKDVDPEAANNRAKHQSELIQKKMDAALKKSGRATDTEDDGADLENEAEIESYGSIIEYPPRLRLNQIMVDKTHDAVLVPWQGTLVPISLLAIKSVSKSDEGGVKHFLRFNLFAPGGALGKDVAPQMAGAIARRPDAVYVKTLNFMSRDGRNFTAIEQTVKNMLKKLREVRKEEKETTNLIEQPPLQIVRGGSTPSMNDINMWPSISGRRTTGKLEVHSNGFLFRSNKSEVVEIVFSNIKVGIMQPCDGEHIVLIHFSLRHPILIGKKKHREVQFYTEVVDSSEALDARGRNDYDPDELADEDRQRQMRQSLNLAFFKFVRKVEAIAVADPNNGGFSSFDVPKDATRFQGAPFKEMTQILLSSSSIISVVDKPPLVAAIEDMELVHFERVFHGGKTFDMVIVLKSGVADKGTPEFIRITGIEMKYLNDIKDWLDAVAEVVFTESLESLDWAKIIPEQVRTPEFWLDKDDSGADKYPGIDGVMNEVPVEGEGGENAASESEESEAYEGESEDSDSDDEDDDDDSVFDEDEESDGESEASGSEDGASEEEDDWDEVRCL